MKSLKYFYNISERFDNKFNLIKNSSILSTPSILGVFLSLISIPIHLGINGKEDYGNYIFFHFLFSFGLLLNFGINKITAIEISKKKNISEIIKQSIKNSLYIIISVLIIFCILNFAIWKIKSFSIIGLGLSVTIIYFTLEGVLQGLKRFKLLSLVNFIFFTLSLNLPSIILLTNYQFNFFNLIIISILIKIISIFLILYSFKKYLLDKRKANYRLFPKLKKYSKWYFVHISNIQIYDFIDKYFIKLILGPVSLAIYSIPYQLAGKITVLSKSIAAVLLPNISSGNEIRNFNYSIRLYVFLIPLFLLIFFPLIDEFLRFWLKDEYSNEILQLTKIFLVVAWMSGISHIFIAHFEAKGNIKFNTILELYFIIPFIIILFLIIFYLKNLIFVCLFLILKELILILIRSNKLRKYITSLEFIYINIIFVIICSLTSVYLEKYFIFTYLTLLIFNLFIIKRWKK